LFAFACSEQHEELVIMFGDRSNSLSFETLEQKQMLAGDVLVSMVGGHLVIEGDEAGNQIAISSGSEAGVFVIQGLEGTSVKLADAPEGDPPAPETGLVVEGVRGRVHVDLDAGDDTVVVHDAQFRRGLSIAAGAGADTVRIGAAEDASPDEGAEIVADDANVVVRGSLAIQTGSEDDAIVVGNASIRGHAAISTGDGDDVVELGDALDVEGLLPDDSLSATLRARHGLSVALGAGNDELTLNNVAAGHVALGGGEGDDQFDVHQLTSLALGIHGGDGDGADVVSLSDLKVRFAGLALGDGVDDVDIVDSAFTALAVSLGAGDDGLSLQGVTAVHALLHGGDGEADELKNAADNVFRRLAIRGFELPDALVDTTSKLVGSGPLGRVLGRLRR
jgi:hypothetical protein